MSVYTEIDAQKITQLCSQFGVLVSSSEPIVAGVQNSNWFVDAEDGSKYVLTLFENESVDKVKSLTRLMTTMFSHELPVAVPLMHESGLEHTNYQGKPLQLYPRLDGEHPEYPSEEMAEEVGLVLANLHDTLALINPSNVVEKPVDLEARRDLFMTDLPVEDKKTLYKIWQKYNAVTVGQDFNNLPSGLIHADLFFDNTLWNDQNITGLLDFTEVREDFLLMDIAVTANDFCTDWEDMHFDEDRLECFLRGYTEVRQLSDYEMEVLPVFLAMAAVSFWLFRLNVLRINTEDQRAGDKISTKSPDLMKNLAKIHADKL